MRWARRAAAVAALCLAVAGPCGGIAYATVGVGITAATITLSHPVAPGSVTAMPAVYVKNTGSEAETVALSVRRSPTTPHPPVPPGWVSFGSRTVFLGPGAGKYVTVRLTVPASVAGGSYEGLLAATTASGRVSGGSAVGATAETLLAVTVATPTTPLLRQPWVRILGAAALIAGVVVLVAWAARRSGIRVRIDRTP